MSLAALVWSRSVLYVNIMESMHHEGQRPPAPFASCWSHVRSYDLPTCTGLGSSASHMLAKCLLHHRGRGVAAVVWGINYIILNRGHTVQPEQHGGHLRRAGVATCLLAPPKQPSSPPQRTSSIVLQRFAYGVCPSGGCSPLRATRVVASPTFFFEATARCVPNSREHVLRCASPA